MRVRSVRTSLMVLLLLAAACGPAPVSPPAGPSGTPAVAAPATPVAAISPTPTPPGPTGTGTPDPDGPAGPRLTWSRISDGVPAHQLLPWWFSDGYLALGGVPSGDDDSLGAWFSPDGRTWDVTPLSTRITPCPGWEPRASVTAANAWASGGGAVILGVEFTGGEAACNAERVVAFRSGDGRTWSRSTDFGGGDLEGTPLGVWAAGGAWEAAVQEPDGSITVWTSAGAERWERAAVVAEGELDSVGPVAVSGSDSTRLLTLVPGESPLPALLESSDGRAWRPVPGPPIELGNEGWASVSQLLGPDGSAPFWLVAVHVEDGDGLRTEVWVSPDLASWRSADFPMPAMTHVAHTSEGILALGIDVCADTGLPEACPTDPAQYFLSRDGLAWEPLDAAYGPESFVEGPAGVIGLGGGAAYRLTRYAEDEAFLLAGLRPDARFGCAVRETLPAGAVAGVECAPASGPAEQVGVYLYPTEAALLASYRERMRQAGVRPESGACPRRPGDAAYIPSEGDPAAEPHRSGCFINEFGIANYRITYPESRVYVGVLGRDGNLPALGEWVWAGAMDTPSFPTVWGDPAAEG